MENKTQILERVLEQYEQGQYLDAYETSQLLGPLGKWQGTEPRVLAGRLAGHLGAPRLGRALLRLAWRADPSDPQACYFSTAEMLMRSGPWAAWSLLRKTDEPTNASPEILADWFSLHAHVLADVRDFDQAERWMKRAEQAAPDWTYVWVSRAVLLEHEDRFLEALEAAEQALTLHPWYRPAVDTKAHLLLQLGRDEQAIDFLHQAVEHLQSGPILWRLAVLEIELGRYAEARAHAEALKPMFPLLEKEVAKGLAGLRADAAYHMNDYPEAVRLAKQVDQPFFDSMATRLAEEPVEGQRKMLPVEFIRQHHETCAPATLAALCQFFSQPADHLEIAEAICFGGTPAFRERQWAKEKGLVVREFRVTWESVVELIDRGIPFAMHVGGTGWAHAQAVIGFDSRLGTLLIRDPSERRWFEYLATTFFEDFRAGGPRGMAVLPANLAERFDGLELPESDLYDRQFELQIALDEHDRERAQQVLDQMRSESPNHRLVIESRLRLAEYDADTATVLRCSEQLLSLFPEDGNALLAKLRCLRELGRNEDRLALLDEACRREKADPLFWQQYGEELSGDARQANEAIRWLRRSIRARRREGRTYRLLADVIWDRQQREEALDLYRFSACMEETDQQSAQAYFIASRYLKRADEAIELMRDRFERFGGRSGWPARTLCWAHAELEQVVEADRVLEQALERRPEDGDLLLYAAEVQARIGDESGARALMDRAKPRSHRMRWLRTAASLAYCQADIEGALGFWQQVVEAEPLAVDAHEMVARFLADTQGPDAAIEHLRNAVERFPHHYALRVLLIGELSQGDPAGWESAVSELLDIHPIDPWARRELAVTELVQGKHAQALETARFAMELEPNHPAAHVILGHAYRDSGNRDDAKRAYRESIRISVDHEQALSALVNVCHGKEERLTELKFIYEELVRQVLFGEGLLIYRDLASMTLDAEALLKVLHEALDARPDLWHAHAALIRHLTEMERFDEAHQAALLAVDRFPLLPTLWVDLATICRCEKNTEGEIEALRKAHEINPNWSDAARSLGETLQREEQFDEAKRVLQRTVAQQPGNVLNLGCLADVLWHLDEKENAIERLCQAVRLEPGYDWAWQTLAAWGGETEQPNLARDIARDLTKTRPYETMAWFTLADLLEDPKHREECLAALKRTIELTPRMLRAYELMAYYLCEDGRFDEAHQICRPKAFGDQIPWSLSARAAEIEAMQGNLDEAINRMKEVAVENPDEFRIWFRLAEWYDESGQMDPFLNAAERLIQIDPKHPVSWGMFGDAKRRTDDAASACEAFEHAIERDPSYWFASANLFELYLDDSRTDDAVALLDRVEEHIPPHFLSEFQIRLAVAKDEPDLIAKPLQALCQVDESQSFSLRRAVETTIDTSCLQVAKELLEEQIQQPEVNSEVGTLLIELHANHDDWNRCVRLLRSLPEASEIWYCSAAEYVSQLGVHNRQATFGRFIDQKRDALRAHPWSWATVGRVYCQTSQDANTVDWLADWPDRDDVTPSPLAYLAISYWELRQPNEAVLVHSHAMTLPPDGMSVYHFLWMAAYEACEGDLSNAAETLAKVNPCPSEPFYQEIQNLAAGMIEIRQQSDQDRRRLGFFAERRALQNALKLHWELIQQKGTLRWLYFRALRRLAQDHHRSILAAWYAVRIKMS